MVVIAEASVFYIQLDWGETHLLLLILNTCPQLKQWVLVIDGLRSEQTQTTALVPQLSQQDMVTWLKHVISHTGVSIHSPSYQDAKAGKIKTQKKGIYTTGISAVLESACAQVL